MITPLLVFLVQRWTFALFEQKPYNLAVQIQRNSILKKWEKWEGSDNTRF